MGGVVFDCWRINKINEKRAKETPGSRKLSLFLGLGCKPMKDVIFTPTINKLAAGEFTVDKLQKMFNYLDWADERIYIEAIPEKLTEKELTYQHWDLIDYFRGKP